MINKLMCYIMLIVVSISGFSIHISVFAEDEKIDKNYKDITSEFSLEQRVSLGDYLSRFGACYTTSFESDKGGKIEFDTNNWTREMSEIIWWQYLGYSKRDIESPNAPRYGNTKTVTPEALRTCVKNTFDVDNTPDSVRRIADDYYIDHSDGSYHPPQQDPSSTMWTRSPESCKVQYIALIDDGTYLVHFMPEYLQSARGMHNGSIYYAKLSNGNTSSGYVATEIGTVSALDDKYIKMGFLEDAKNGSQSVSNINIDYSKTEEFASIDEYGAYLRDILSVNSDKSLSGTAINEVAAYISAACLRNSKIEFEAEDNVASLSFDSLSDSASAAVNTSTELWKIAGEYDVKPNKDIVTPIQIIIRNLDEKSSPKVVFEENLKDDDMGISNMRILIGDNSHGIVMDKPTCNRIIDNHGTFTVEVGSSMRGGFIINFYDEHNKSIDKLPTKINFSIPAENQFDSVYTTTDGRDFNIGGIYDKNNKALEFKTNTSGIYKVKSNVPDISDIGDLTESEQQHIKLLVSKDYFATTGTRFKPDEQYTNFDAARAVSGILFTVDTDARTKYNDIDEADPQSMYVASIEEAGVKLYSDQGGLRFNGNSAVGLEDAFTLSLDLLVSYKGYYVPDMGSDSDRPYESVYLNFPDIQYMKKSSLGYLALGAREGIINDGMALCNTENRFDRKSAAEFLYRLFDRMCEVAPTKFDAGSDGYKSSSSFYNPLATMSFETPIIVYIYLGCFVIGLIFAFVLYMMEKKNKIVNENAVDARNDDDYWNEY